MPALLPSATARARSAGGRLVRRMGLLPGGEPDGLGEDARYGGLMLEERVLAFFPEPPRNAYQLEQWLEPLAVLHERHGVVIVTQDSRTTARLRAATSLPVLCVGRTATLEALLRRSAVGLALYVSHHPRNFQCLRFSELAHAYLGHGESDKAVSSSNQLKAYDRVFVAGQAAVDRITAELLWFDSTRAVHIGRPQLAPTERISGEPRTVLYAPTWEGAQASMAYSSVESHGVPLVRSLVASGLRVLYRPHPRTGANRRSAAEADGAVRSELAAPAATALGAAVVADVPLADAFGAADLLVTDVSSLAVEWLPTGRPLVVTMPAEHIAADVTSRLLAAVPRLLAEEAGTAGLLMTELLADDQDGPARSELAQYYLTATGAQARDMFLGACGALLRERDAARGALARAAR